MRPRLYGSLVMRVALFAALAALCTAVPAAAQVGSNCTVSVLNRSVTQNADGSWVLPNVPANFGPVRARVTCLINGQTISGESDPFTVPANGVVNLPPIRFGQTTPIPTALTLTAPATTLMMIGETTQLAVTARYSDNSTQNVTAASTFTQYTVSNSAIATVGADGLVQAVQSGTVLIQATHEGASGMISLRVALGGGADTDGDGIPDADELALGMNPNNAIDALEDFDRDGLTNLQEYQLGTEVRKADTDGDGLKDGDEGARGTNPLLRDSDGDGFGDGLELQTGSDPLNPSSFNLAGALSRVDVSPSNFTLTFNTIGADVSVQLSVIGTLRDGGTLDLTSPLRGTSYSSSDLTVCSFSGTPGRVFAGQAGTCVVTATVAGMSGTASGMVNAFPPRALSSVRLPGPGNGVDVNGDVVYVATGAAGLQVVDASNHAAPRLAGSLALPGSANDVKIDGTHAYVAAGPAGLHVVDVTTPFSPVLLGSVDTPGSANDVRTRGNLAFVADGDGGLQIIDVTTPTAPRIIAVAPVGTATGVDVTETLAVVTVGAAGVVTVNISNPSVPVILGGVDTPGEARDVAVNGDFAYVADYTGSLRAIDLRNPGAPVLAGTTPTSLGGILFDVARADSFVFGADIFFVNGVPIVDVSDAGNLRPRAILNFPGDATGLGIAVDGSYVYLGTDTSQIFIGQYRIQEDLNGIPPTVTLRSPVNGSVFVEGETIAVTVEANDDLAVVNVSLQVDGATVASDSTAPYQFTLKAPNLETTLVLGANAVDLGNNVGTATGIGVSVIADPLTTITGRVVLPNGLPFGGGIVSCNGASTTTLGSGLFTLDNVVTVPRATGCTIGGTGTDGTVLSGVAAAVLVRGGVTDLGDVTIAPVPVIASISPSVFDVTRPPTSIQITGSNLVGATFEFLPNQPPAITVGLPVVNAAGTAATLPISISTTAHGRYTLVGTNDFGGADPTPTAGNSVRVISAADDIDSDGDGFPDGLELLFGSDPADASSKPDLATNGDVMSRAVSVVNQTLPFSVEKNSTQWFTVRNTTFPFTVEKSSAQWFTVRNTAFPFTVERSSTQWFTVRNTTFPFTVQKNSMQWFSVVNSFLPPQSQIVVSPLVSVWNIDQATLQSQETAAARLRDAATNGPLTAVSLDAGALSGPLVEGQTITINATVSGGQGVTVTFTVNDLAFAADPVAPYAWTFTVPSGVRTLTFGASAQAGPSTLVATPIAVAVEPDLGMTIRGRIVDMNGNPVAGAVIDLLSQGLAAEFFDPGIPFTALPDLTGATPVRRTRVTAVNMRGPGGIFGFDPFGTGRAPDYAARFSGWLAVTTPGEYTFSLGADEGARLRVGGVTLVNMPTSVGGFQEGSGTVTLDASLVPVEITFFQSTGSTELQLSVTPPGGVRQIVPPSMLVPAVQPLVAVTDGAGRYVISAVPTVLQNVRVRATVYQNGQGVSSTMPVAEPLSNVDVELGDFAVPSSQ